MVRGFFPGRVRAWKSRSSNCGGVLGPEPVAGVHGRPLKAAADSTSFLYLSQLDSSTMLAASASPSVAPAAARHVLVLPALRRVYEFKP